MMAELVTVEAREHFVSCSIASPMAMNGLS
jgi:hypothetical protein